MSVIWNQKRSNKCTDELKEKASIDMRWFTWEEGKSLLRGRGLREDNPAPGTHVSSAARVAASRQWSLYFTKAPSWRSTAFVPNDKIPRGQSFHPFCEGWSPALAHLGLQGTWGCSGIPSWLSGDHWKMAFLAQTSMETHERQKHGWWICPVL